MEHKVHIFDTTLRDGEQSPGASLTGREKLEIAHQLARLNVDVIEAGFPCSSPGDFKAVQEIARSVKGPVITALARAVKADIDAVWESVREAERPRIHIVLGSSDIHAKHKFRRSREELLAMGVEAVRYARTLCPDVEYSTEDASRSDRRYLYQVLEAVIEAGATVVNIPDTVGYAVPAQWGRLIADIRRNVRNIDQAILSVHCHNDLGMAVANSLAAVRAGAQQVECTINGIGERAGNASLEEVVMALKVRRNYYGAYTDVVTSELCRTSSLVSRLTGLTVARNKAVVGANAFAHSSGIHQDGVLKNRDNYEIFSPDDVGASGTEIILTARSGRHAVRHRLEGLGYTLTPEELERVHQRFLAVADAKKEVFDEDLHALMADERGTSNQTYDLESFRVTSGTGVCPTATVALRSGEAVLEQSASGDGPMDACFSAIDRITGLGVTLKEYQLNAATAEKGALGLARVTLERDGATATGQGASTDVVEAGVRAYISALNRLLARAK
ncbi:MAG TPA: 2-isopropylmalate synthase [Armatimonadota bacterium]|nr:2-isopropylmalate synthase [Armatimonadota bacterium]HOM83900.1 2-isopropylmalate synthase [Armatimonadota bacterium]HPO74014.1 2-isopropylmalate synthase [Armatimonadota bacterium]HPT98281.1 2-isopropylmalate synthase [Armatimonadota bacterium]